GIAGVVRCHPRTTHVQLEVEIDPESIGKQRVPRKRVANRGRLDTNSSEGMVGDDVPFDQGAAALIDVDTHALIQGSSAERAWTDDVAPNHGVVRIEDLDSVTVAVSGDQVSRPGRGSPDD